MTFTLPSNPEQAAVFRKVLGIIVHYPAGCALIDDLRHAYSRGANKIALYFDPHLVDQHGNCRKTDHSTTVCLRPGMTRAHMHTVLCHELRHCRQVPARNALKGEAFRRMAHFTLRLREGDAFVHQFALAIDSNHAGLIDAAFSVMSRGRDDLRRDLDGIADDWLLAATPQEKQTVMARLFWHVQETLLPVYAEQTDARLRQLIENRGEADVDDGLGRQLDEACLHHLLDNMALPPIVAGTRDGSYLGTDYEAVSQRLAALAPQQVSVTQKSAISKHPAPC